MGICDYNGCKKPTVWNDACEDHQWDDHIPPTVTKPIFEYGTAEEHCCYKHLGHKQPMRMICCPTCGNKRCPKASDCTLSCTNSNDLNQPGSIYQTQLKDKSMPCTVDPTPEEIRQSVEATQKREKDIRNTINNLASMLCTMCRMHIDQKLPIPTPIHDWYIKHQQDDQERLIKAKKRALNKLDDEEKEALGL